MPALSTGHLDRAYALKTTSGSRAVRCHAEIHGTIKMDPVFTLSFTGDGDERGMWVCMPSLAEASPLQ